MLDISSLGGSPPRASSLDASSLDTSKVRGLFFDLDGTLLSRGSRHIPESSIYTLRRAHEHGMLLFIATGRHFFSLQPTAGLPFSGHVCLNGQHCLAGGKTVFSNPIPKEEIAAMVGCIEAKPYVCHCLSDSECFTNRADPWIHEIFEDLGIAPFPVNDIKKSLEMDVLQVELFVSDDGEADELVAKMPSCRWTRWHPAGIDILRDDGGKWTGIEKIMGRFQLSREEVMVFGDADNDVGMLRNSMFSVAMGNGTPAAKAAAKYVAGDIDADGLMLAAMDLLPQLKLRF